MTGKVQFSLPATLAARRSKKALQLHRPLLNCCRFPTSYSPAGKLARPGRRISNVAQWFHGGWAAEVSLAHSQLPQQPRTIIPAIPAPFYPLLPFTQAYTLTSAHHCQQPLNCTVRLKTPLGGWLKSGRSRDYDRVDAFQG